VELVKKHDGWRQYERRSVFAIGALAERIGCRVLYQDSSESEEAEGRQHMTAGSKQTPCNSSDAGAFSSIIAMYVCDGAGQASGRVPISTVATRRQWDEGRGRRRYQVDGCMYSRVLPAEPILDRHWRTARMPQARKVPREEGMPG
jgi:hypothetical protein